MSPDHVLAPPRIRTGVYHLVSAGRVLYVGQSINVMARIGMHAHEAYDEIHIFYCDPEDLSRIEREHIERLQPPLNRAGRVWPYIPTQKRTLDRFPLTRTSFESACVEAARRIAAEGAAA